MYEDVFVFFGVYGYEVVVFLFLQDQWFYDLCGVEQELWCVVVVLEVVDGNFVVSCVSYWVVGVEEVLVVVVGLSEIIIEQCVDEFCWVYCGVLV